jgi:Flp pilus assembly protein TadD
LSPNDPRALGHYSAGYLQQGQMKEAVEYAQRAADVTSRNPVFLCLLAGTQHRAGLTKEAERTLAEVTQIASKDYVPDVFLAIANLWMRGPEAAMPLLQRAYDRRDGYLVIIKSTPWFDSMRGHPGYQELVRRMNFPR